MDPNLLQCLSVFDTSQTRPLFQRACVECRRKKTRCEMQRPSCALCSRIGVECVYPTERKSRRRPPRNLLHNRSLVSHSSRHAHNASPSMKASSRTLSVPSSFSTVLPQSPQAENHILLDTSGETGVPDLSITDPTINLPDAATVDPASISCSNDLTCSIPALPNIDPLTHSSPDSTSFDFAFADLLFNEDMLGLPSTNPGPTLTPNVGSEAPSLEFLSSISTELGVSEDEAGELIELFFDRVHPFLPLLHRPQFEAEFLDATKKTLQWHGAFSEEIILLINAMFALAARFSGKITCDLDPKRRGLQFADRARNVFNELIARDSMPSLRFLQGCILLTYHDLTSKPSFRSWLNVSACCRIAYCLWLHQIDLTSTATRESDTRVWARKEEERRAWWAVYQMDNFASICAGRPFNLDSNRIAVNLPVSDADWFNYRLSSSISLSAHKPNWEKMSFFRGCSPYAWFIVSNIFLRAAFDQFGKSEYNVQEAKILQTSLHCLGLILPTSVRNSSFTDAPDFTDTNWAICTLILLQIAHIFTVIVLETVNATEDEPNAQADSPQTFGKSVARNGSPLRRENLFDMCAHQISEHLRSVKMWSSEAIVTASPLITCALIGPAAIFTTEPSGGKEGDAAKTLRSLERQIVNLVLCRFAEFWELGQYVYDLVNNVVSSNSPIEIESSSKKERAYVAGLLPDAWQV